jgi:hypothetical protein
MSALIKALNIDMTLRKRPELIVFFIFEGGWRLLTPAMLVYVEIAGGN